MSNTEVIAAFFWSQFPVQRQTRKALTIMELLGSAGRMGELAYTPNRINQLLPVYIKHPK